MTYKNILIIKLSALGDVIHAIPVAHALKNGFPDARLTWIVEKPSYDILSNNPYLDEIIIFDKPKFKSLRGLIAHAPELITSLRRKKFDLALDLQGLFKSSAIAFLSGAPVRLVCEYAREGSALLSKRIAGPYANGHIVDRHLDIVRALCPVTAEPAFSIFLKPAETAKAKNILENIGLGGDAPYVVLALGSSRANKIWPAENFAELCGRLYAEGITPVAVGAAADTALFEKLTAVAKRRPVNLIGKTSLKELAYIIGHAGVFVGGDTGPLHLAVAMNTPVVALVGPSNKDRNGPYPVRGSKQRVLITDRHCAGCWQRKCPQDLDADCLAKIGVEDVFQATVDIMQKV